MADLADHRGRQLLVAVDFDGTIVEHDYPKIGRPVPLALETMRELQDLGADLILWTMRSGVELAEAVSWLTERGIRLFGVNCNPETNWSDSPKAYAHVYIDDAAVGCPLMQSTAVRRLMVDWSAIRAVLIAMAKARNPAHQ